MEHLHQTLVSLIYVRITGKSSLPEELIEKVQSLIEKASGNLKKDMDTLYAPDEYEARLQYLWDKSKTLSGVLSVG